LWREDGFGFHERATMGIEKQPRRRRS